LGLALMIRLAVHPNACTPAAKGLAAMLGGGVGQVDALLKALETDPKIQTKAGDRDLEDLVVPEGYTMRRS